MSVVISSSYVIAPSATNGGIINGDNPVIGWDNVLGGLGLLSTTTADPDFPTANMLTNSTNLRWKGAATEVDEYITVLNQGAGDIDYIAIARHNLGSEQIPVSVEFLESVGPDVWTELVEDVILPNDGPALFRFPKLAYLGIRLRMQVDLEEPVVAVVYCGELLVLQRRLYVGHAPINYSVETRVANGMSESGDFLGRIVLGEATSTQLQLVNLSPDWLRTYLAPFLAFARSEPFFMAWRPEQYPLEVGYCWLTNDPKPVNQRSRGHMQVDLQMGGVT